MNMKICTLNCKNSDTNRNGGMREDGIDNSLLLSNYIKQDEIVILGTQELTKNISNSLLENLTNYRLYGSYRFKKIHLLKFIKSLNIYNENNAIITNKKVILCKTKWYPFLLKLLLGHNRRSSIPRILTYILINDENIGNFYFLNTQLDYKSSLVQKLELNYLFKIIKKLSRRYPIIITGDFNMEVGTIYFDKFISSLSKIGLKRVPVNCKTNKRKFINKSAIDHIFIPNNWQIEDCGVLDSESLKGITDHYGVFVNIKF